MSIIIYGPSGCGKSLNKEKLAKLFNCTLILDNYIQEALLPENTIAFMQERPIGNHAIRYDAAIKLYLDWISLCPPKIYMLGENPEDLAIDFEQARENAVKNEWRQPRISGDRNDMVAWINYWNQMAEHDRKVVAGDTDPGRPIIPHYSG